MNNPVPAWLVPADHLLVDAEQLIELRSTMRQRAARLARMYLDELPKRLALIETALQNANQQQALLTMHTLVGSSNALALKGFADACRHLEECLRGDEWQTVQNDWSALQALAERSRRALETLIYEWEQASPC